jgi:predicted permease
VLDRGVLPRLDEIAVDPQMLAFALGLSLLTGLLFGLAPALRLARVDRRARQDRASRPRHGDGPTRTRTGQRLTMAQLVLATTLLVGAGLLINSFVRLAWLDVGFDRHALSVQVVIPTEYSLPRKLALAYEARDRLAALPGISAVGFTDRPPLANSGFRGPVVPLGAEWLGMGQADMALLRFISPGVLPALGVRLLDGRELDARDAALRPYSLLVNRAYARRFFGDASPVGELVRWGTVGVFAVVGVVEDFRFQMPETALTSPAPRASEREPAVFMIATVIQPEDGADAFANAVSGDTVSFLVRTDGDPSALLPDLPGLLRQVDPALAVEEASTLGEVIDGLNTRPRFYAVTLGIFAAVAVFLAAVGIYGVLAHTVTQRTREIGIRMAVGARPNQVIGLILQEAVGMVAIGLVVGLAMAVAFTRALTGMLYGLSVLDPLTYGGVLAVLAAGALLASWVPARRATKVDPLVALRCE